ncbi:MAG TPA: TetR/AcrR family transcriptional regulator [Kofleriaceae bacterium]
MGTKRKAVKRRNYDSTHRTEAARQTRQRILDVARELFVSGGYAGFTMQEIAVRSEVALDTVYASVGRKPQLVRLLVETAISNTDQAVPAEQRAYVKRVQAAASARDKLAIYAAGLVEVLGRLAPIVRALESAATVEPELGKIWREISERRARNMRLFAAELVKTGQLRADLTLDRVADVIWAMNGPELYMLLVTQRGWSADEFATWLADAWTRLLVHPR